MSLKEALIRVMPLIKAEYVKEVSLILAELYVEGVVLGVRTMREEGARAVERSLGVKL